MRFKNYIAAYFLTSFILFSSSTAFSQYVYDPSKVIGAGLYKDYLIFFNWAGKTLSNTTPSIESSVTYNGVTYTATISEFVGNKSSTIFNGADINTWTSSGAVVLYNNTDFSEALLCQNIGSAASFKVKFTASDGSTDFRVVPIDMESTSFVGKDSPESEKIFFTTDGSPFTFLEDNVNNKFSENNGTTNTAYYTVSGAGTQNLGFLNTDKKIILGSTERKGNALFSTQGTNISVSMPRMGGGQAIGFAIIPPFKEVPANLTVPSITIKSSEGTTISGTATPNSTIAVDIDKDGITDYTTVTDASGNWSITPTTKLANGTFISALATNGLGLASSPATTTVTGTLAINLLSFTAVAKTNCTVSLTWLSGEEQQFNMFEVEKRIDGKFVKIGTVKATGNNSSYKFEDSHPLTEVNLYRLKMINNDGSYEYSKISSVYTNCSVSNIIVYPSITNNSVTVSGLSSGDLVIVHSAVGQLLYKDVVNGTSIRIDMSRYSPSLYFVSIYRNNQRIATSKVIKN